MPISALNFFWLADPHDLQGIAPPSCVKLQSQNSRIFIYVKRGNLYL
jgi:hypothetical protein